MIPYEDRGAGSLFFSPDGTLLASHREDKIFLNDVADGKLKEKWSCPFLTVLFVTIRSHPT